MHAHVSLLAIVALPLLAGLLILGFEGAWRRWFGPERALALAGRVALAGTLLSALLLAAAVYALRVRPDLAPTQPVPWAGAGYTTALDLDLQLGGLALAVAAVALVTALGVQLAALADVRAGARGLGRAGVLLGGTLLLALAASLWGAALGWQIVVMACLMGHGAGDRSPGTGARWTDAGVWLAVLVTAVGAGDLAIGVISRAGLFGAQASLLVGALGGPFVGVTPAGVAAAALVVAVLGRIAGLPAVLRGAPAATRAAVLGLASGAGVLLLLRAHMLLVLAPTVMATLAVAGAVIAALAGVAALRAEDHAQTGARVAQSLLGFMLVAVGLGAWAPACGLLLAHGLASGALALGLEAEGGAGHAARVLAGLSLAGVLPTGAALWLGETLGAAWMYMSAWSPGINAVTTGLCALAIVCVAGSLGQVLKDRSKGPGGAEVGLGAAMLATATAIAALGDLPGSLTALRAALSPEFGPSWMLPGDLALGPRPPYTVVQARWGVVALVVLALAGLVLAGRLRGLAARLPVPAWPDGRAGRRVARGLVAGLHELGEVHVLPRVFLAPALPGVARAPGASAPRRGWVLTLVGALMVLGVVYCNPDVAQVGPSRVYPVDLGGINPALLGSRRPGSGAPESAPVPTPAEPGLTLGTGAASTVPGRVVPGAGVGPVVPGAGVGAAASETSWTPPELGPRTVDAPGPGSDAPVSGTSEALVPRAGEALAPGAGEALAPGAGAAKLVPGTGAAKLVPGTGAELTPGAGEAKLAPGTGEAKLVPGTGAELTPGTGEAKLAPGTGEAKLAPGTGEAKLAPGTGAEVGR